mgnify:CR=1 FL=1
MSFYGYFKCRDLKVDFFSFSNGITPTNPIIGIFKNSSTSFSFLIVVSTISSRNAKPVPSINPMTAPIKILRTLSGFTGAGFSLKFAADTIFILSPFNNEGTFVLAIEPKDEIKALEILREFDSNANTIGEILDSNKGNVIIQNSYGASRFMEPPKGELLPRIC